MDVVDWLRSLGLERYEAAFRDNEIDERVLASLTQEDLKEIGVGPVGHRRMLLEAIAVLRGDTSGNAPSADVANTSSVLRVSPEDRAERRQVTVMFSDLVGSTALSARIDPEDLREVISAYQNSVSETVGRFGGFVAKYMGDGVLVYFGYPQAHEDDAERAVRAGLQLVAAIGDLKTHAALRTRVGIATGLVVVGDLIGSGASQERAIVGDTPNLAARLQGVAEPNSVVIADSTRKLVGGLFELDGLGPQELKGISGPTPAWRALRPASVEGRFEAMHASGRTDLVGRKEELDLLLRRWSKAKSGEGQVVLLSGEAGIGKSRLTAALLESLAAEQHTRLRYFCSPQHTDSAFYPIIGQMERAAGLAHDDTAQARLDKLDAMLVQTSTSLEDAALFAEMLSLPNDGHYPTLELTSQQRRQRTLDALIAQTEALTRQNPVLMIFEDAHWTDPTSLELFGRAVDRITPLRVLLIVTFRPEFEPPWIGRPHVTTLTINRLVQRDIDAMIDRVVGNKLIPASVRQDIIERTDGIPLFVEEMTKAVLEAASEGEARRTAAAVPLPALAVPASLHASLMARLDRLGPAKGVAQIGAAIGREFSHALLATVVPKPEVELTSALDRLVAAGLLFRQGMPPHASYLFKHALVQDAAYGTLLRGPRRALHACIAEALETQFTEIAENRPELLARHCTEAGLIEKAAGLWGKAGLRSLERSALVEAVQQLSRALEQISSLPVTPALRQEQIRLQVALINPLSHTKGFPAPDTKAAVEQARLLIEQAEALGEPPEDPLLLLSVLYGSFVANHAAANGEVMLDLAEQLLALAEKLGTTASLIIGHRIMGVALLCTGNIIDGHAHLNRAIALYDPVEHRSLSMRFGQDMSVVLFYHRSLALWFLGYPEAAVAAAEQALTRARETGQAATLMYALAFTTLTPIFCGDYRTARFQLDELVSAADERGVVFWKAVATSFQGVLLSLTGGFSNAEPLIVEVISAYRSAGSKLFLSWSLSNLAKAAAQLEQFGAACNCIREAIATVEVTGERWTEPEVYRVAGEIELMMPKPDLAKAEAHFERALAIARQQQAKSWELRAATSMARLWRDQGKSQHARELLAPVYGWFTEGFDTLDLQEAKELLLVLA
jgi:class 3 adenylate cyclase/predicted ATPase